MRPLVKIFIFLISINSGIAQESIPIGTWRSHFNYKRTHLIEKVGDKIYCAAQSGLFYFDTSDNSLNKLSKIEGLSDTKITAMAYEEASAIFVLGYDNGNIDILENNEILNVAGIKKSDINDSKTINDITIRNGRIYISTNFGVIVVKNDSGEIVEAYQNLGINGESVKINGVVIQESEIYLASNFGVLKGTIAQYINLQDFNNWERFDGTLVSDQKIVSIASFNDKIITTDGSSIFSYDGTDWEEIEFDNSGGDIVKLKNQQDKLLIISEAMIHSLESNSEINHIDLEENAIVKDALIGSAGNLWYADFSYGLSRMADGITEHFIPNGIFEGVVGKLQLVKDMIVALPLSRSSLYQPINNTLGYAEFGENGWRIIPRNQLSGLENVSSISEDGRFISSFGDGVLNTEEGIIYDNTNSTLTKSGVQQEDILVSGVSQDNDGNTWIATSSNRPLQKVDATGTWQAYSFGISASERPVDIKLNNIGQVWMQLSHTNSGGILVFNPATEKSRYLTSTNGKLPSTKVTDFEFAKDDEVWIGTENGLAFFPFFSGITEDLSIEASRPVIDNQFLFEFEIISAIEIDAGNRKWVGTKDGLWLFEDNPDKLLQNLNVDNSPIPSNNIIDLKINPHSGELFISTDKGLVSFRGDATRGENFHHEVKIFPNPVLPGYTGLVGISGLVDDAIVKITNVSGKLVKELRASGGSTSWDVADYNSKRAESGVYLVFSSSSDGKETFVGKVAVIN